MRRVTLLRHGARRVSAQPIAVWETGRGKSAMKQRQQLIKRKTAKAQAPARRGNNGNGASTRFSSDHQPQRRRGPDILPRGSIKLLYRTLLEDDGSLEQSLK